MRTLKFTSIFCLFVFMSGCTPQWEQEQERINTSNNKLTISNFEVGKPSIVIENVQDFYSSIHGYITYKKDNKEYEYKGDYLFEVEVTNKLSE